MSSVKGAIFAYGRFNPPTIGHQYMFDEMFKVNEDTTDPKNPIKLNLTPYIVTTHSHDAIKNPLAANSNNTTKFTKKKILQIMNPGVTVWATSKSEWRATDIARRIMRENPSFKVVYLYVGSDQVESFQWVKNRQAVRNVLTPIVRRINQAGRNNYRPATVTASRVRAASLLPWTETNFNHMMSNKLTKNEKNEIRQTIRNQASTRKRKRGE